MLVSHNQADPGFSEHLAEQQEAA